VLVGVDASRAVGRRRTGTETYSYHLIRNLLSLGSPHRYVVYFNTPPAPGDFAGLAADIRSMPFPRLWTHLRLSIEMVRQPPDVLFVPAHVLPAIHPRRTVVTVHDLGHLRWPETHALARRLYLDLSTRRDVSAATFVVAVSGATRDDLIRYYGVPAAKIRVVHHACGPEFRPQSEREVAGAREKYGIDGDYVITVGTVQPRKNLARLIEAFGSARASAGSRATLVVAGGPGWRAEEAYRAAEPLGGAVRFLGYVPHDDLPPLLGGAGALAFPSLHEGFGLPALEAMACGTPVVASNTSSLPEVVGDAALLVDPTDVDSIAQALARTLGDSDLRARLRERGLERARLFSWRRCAEETLRVLEEAVAAPG